MPQDPVPGLTPGEIYKRKLREDALLEGLPQNVRNSKAQELLRTVLGTPGLKIGPALRGFGDIFTNPSNEPRTDKGHEYVKFTDEASPNISSAYHSAIRDYPGLASKRINGLYDLPDDDSDRLGNYNLLNGRMGIRRTLGSKSLSQNDLRDTILHELSHAVGTEDDIGNYDISKPVSAYNISAASKQLHDDVYLPSDDSTTGVNKKRVKGLR
jgi:hypothetical protein